MIEFEKELLEWVEQAREMQGRISEASQAIRAQSLEVPDLNIGEIYDPVEFRSLVTNIRQTNRPLVEKVSSARQQVDHIAFSVASTIIQQNLLDQIQAEHERVSMVLRDIEEGVVDGSLPQDYLFFPNVSFFKVKADAFGLMLELYERGIELISKGEEEVERQELLGMITIKNREKGVILVGDKIVELKGIVNREVFYRLYKDLEEGWQGIGVHSSKIASIAREGGSERVDLAGSAGSIPVSKLNEVFDRRRLAIRIYRTVDPVNNRLSYYRIRKRIFDEEITDPGVDTITSPQQQELLGDYGPYISPQSRIVFS